jgi:hypothetical protein
MATLAEDANTHEVTTKPEQAPLSSAATPVSAHRAADGSAAK